MFRKFLIILRRYHKADVNKGYLYSGLGIFFFMICSFVVDKFLPFVFIYNFVRTLILIPLSLSIFIFSYFISLTLHDKKFKEDPDWVPYRLRLSVSWRRRIAIIITAFLFVFGYAAVKQVGYTLISSCIIAIIIALLAYIRTTRDEENLEYLNIPDTRDIKYQDNLEELKNKRLAKNKKKDEK